MVFPRCDRCPSTGATIAVVKRACVSGIFAPFMRISVTSDSVRTLVVSHHPVVLSDQETTVAIAVLGQAEEGHVTPVTLCLIKVKRSLKSRAYVARTTVRHSLLSVSFGIG